MKYMIGPPFRNHSRKPVISVVLLAGKGACRGVRVAACGVMSARGAVVVVAVVLGRGDQRSVRAGAVPGGGRRVLSAAAGGVAAAGGAAGGADDADVVSPGSAPVSARRCTIWYPGRIDDAQKSWS